MDRRRKHRLTQMRITIGAILLVALLIGILVVGFHIRKFEVVGNTRHTAEEIRGDLVRDFATGNSLYFSWKYKNAVEEPITPYLSSVQAKMTAPGAVQVVVSEKKIVAGTTYGGTNVYFDETGLVLEITDTHYDDVPLVKGITMDEPQLYQKLPVSNAALLATMLKLASLMGQSGLVAEEITFDESRNMTVKVADILIELGQDEYLAEKISNLVTIYPKIAGAKGTLKLSSYTGKTDDIQFEEAMPEPETQAQEWQWQQEGEGTGETDAYGNPVTTGETDAYGNPVTTGETDAYGNPVTGTSADSQGAAGMGTQPEPAPEGGDGAETTPEGTGEDTPGGSGEVTGVEGFMVFDSNGTLRYDARVVDGQVLDAYGNPISGCSVNEDGYVVDAYWNVIDPMTGTLAQ